MANVVRFGSVAFEVDRAYAFEAAKDPSGAVVAAKVWVDSSNEALKLDHPQEAGNFWSYHFRESKQGRYGSMLLLDDRWGLRDDRIAHVTFDGLPAPIKRAVVTMAVGTPERFVQFQLDAAAAYDLSQLIRNPLVQKPR